MRPSILLRLLVLLFLILLRLSLLHLPLLHLAPTRNLLLASNSTILLVLSITLVLNSTLVELTHILRQLLRSGIAEHCSDVGVVVVGAGRRRAGGALAGRLGGLGFVDVGGAGASAGVVRHLLLLFLSLDIGGDARLLDH